MSTCRFKSEGVYSYVANVVLLLKYNKSNPILETYICVCVCILL